MKTTNELLEDLRRVFTQINDAVHAKQIINNVHKNLREVGDNPAHILDYFLSYLLNYFSEQPAIGYLEEKRDSINNWLAEIAQFGYKSQKEMIADLRPK